MVLGVKNPSASAQDTREMVQCLGKLGRSLGGRNGNPLQCSCLVDFMDRGAWWAVVHRVAKSQTWLSTHTHTHTHTLINLDNNFTHKILTLRNIVYSVMLNL